MVQAAAWRPVGVLLRAGLDPHSRTGYRRLIHEHATGSGSNPTGPDLRARPAPNPFRFISLRPAWRQCTHMPLTVHGRADDKCVRLRLLGPGNRG